MGQNRNLVFTLLALSILFIGSFGFSQDAFAALSIVPTFVDSFDVSGQDTGPTGVTFSSDGTKMFVVGSTGDAVYVYTLSTPFDVSTASAFVGTFDVSGEETTPTDVAFSSDGTKMFVVGIIGDDVNVYTLSTPFDLSTASAFVGSFDVSGQETGPTGVAFSSDGTKMFVVGFAGGAEVNEYTLSTPFDVSTAAFDSAFPVAGQDTFPTDVAFSSDGTKMFVLGADEDAVYEYTLSTPFDVSTAAFVDSFSVAGEETAPRGIAFSPDCTKMFVVGSDEDNVNEYTLSGDSDGDGVCNDVDVCPGGDDTIDTDGDGIPDFCDKFCGKPYSFWDNVIYGTNKADNLVGTSEKDLIIALKGDDTVKGKGKKDCILGGKGEDNLKGNGGNDKIFGEQNDDKINCGPGNKDLGHGGKHTDTHVNNTCEKAKKFEINT